LDSLLVNNEIDPDEFYAVLARLEDHPLLQNASPSIRFVKNEHDGMMSGKLPISYLGIRADYVGENMVGGYHRDVETLFDELATDDIKFTGRDSWEFFWMGDFTGYLRNEIVISNMRVPVYVKYVKVKDVKKS